MNGNGNGNGNLNGNGYKEISLENNNTKDICISLKSIKEYKRDRGKRKKEEIYFILGYNFRMY